MNHIIGTQTHRNKETFDQGLNTVYTLTDQLIGPGRIRRMNIFEKRVTKYELSRK